MSGRVAFIGAGPGDPELCTVRGRRLIRAADLVLIADSLVQPGIAAWARPGVPVVGTSNLSLAEIVARMVATARSGGLVARVCSGDPSLYGALNEQVAALQAAGVPYEVVPGVSSVFAAAAAAGRSLTLPGVSQTVVLTRVPGRTQHAAGETLAFFLSLTTVGEVVTRLRAAGYPDSTPALVAHRVSWDGQRLIRTTVGDLAAEVRAAGLTRHGLILVGRVLQPEGAPRSRLYDPGYSHLFRRASPGGGGGGA